MGDGLDASTTMITRWLACSTSSSRAETRLSAPPDEIEFPIDLVGPVDGQIDDRVLVEARLTRMPSRAAS